MSSATTWNSGLSRVSRRPKCLTLPDTTISAPTNSRRSMKRRPNQVASMLPVSSSSRAIVRWVRPRKPGSTRTSPTVAWAETTVPSPTQPRSPDLAHLAQVVVAPWQVEQQVADRVEVELDPGPPERRPGGQPGSRQRGRQQLDRVGRDGCDARCLGHPIRRRSGTGRTAARRGGPRPRRRSMPPRSGEPSPPLRPGRRHRRRTA